MKLGLLNIIKKHLTILFLAVAGVLLLNNTFFMHIHKLANGTLVVHAHPVAKSTGSDAPIQGHQHTNIEFLALDKLLLLITLSVLIFQSFALIAPKTFIFGYSYSLRENTPLLDNNKAPPVISFIS